MHGSTVCRYHGNLDVFGMFGLIGVHGNEPPNSLIVIEKLGIGKFICPEEHMTVNSKNDLKELQSK